MSAPELDLSELLTHATPEEIEELEKLLTYQDALADPLEFTCLLSKQTERYPHVRLIADYLLALVEFRLYADGPGPEANWWYLDRLTNEWCPALSRETVPGNARDVEGRHPDDPNKHIVKRLGIAMPPRHGKSWITTQHFPIWLGVVRPGIKVCVYTYSNERGYEWGEDIRERVADAVEDGILGDEVSVRKGRKAASRHFVMKNGSDLRFGGVGGLLTGSGFDVGIIDDPFKGPEDAYSQAERNSKADWYGSVWSNRRESIWAVEVMQFTRWHEDDLSGRYVYDDAGNVLPEWCMLHLPALCNDPDNDPLGREEDEALCPERFNEAYLMAQRQEHPDKFQALYQGDPSMEEGGIIQRPFCYYHHQRSDHRTKAAGQLIVFHSDGPREFVPIKECRAFGVCDIAGTVKSKSDWTVFTLWLMDTQRRIFLWDILRFRAESPDIPGMLLEWYLDRPVEERIPTVLEVGVEKSGSGLPIVQTLQRQGRLSIRALEPKDYGGDKVSRAFPAGAAIKARQIFFPKVDHDRGNAHWMAKFESELKVFPNGTYDDQVDCLGYAEQLRHEYPIWDLMVEENLTIEEQIERMLREREQANQGGSGLGAMLSASRMI